MDPQTWTERLARQMHAKARLCGRCSKVCYDDERQAQQVIREYRVRLKRLPYYMAGESPARVPKRAYFDSRCGVWHVTSSAPTGRDYGDRPGGHVSAPPRFLALPDPPPTPDGEAGVAAYLERVALDLRDAIREQGPGLRLPARRLLERHYGTRWGWFQQARALLVETGWLGLAGERDEVYYLTRSPRTSAGNSEREVDSVPW